MRMAVPPNWEVRGRGHRGPDAAMKLGPQLGERLEALKMNLDAEVTSSEGQNRDLVTCLDQGTSNACMFHGLVQLIHSTHLRMGIQKPLWASRTGLWAQTRQYEHTFPQNTGAFPSNAYMITSRVGYTAEVDLPWDPSGQTKPPLEFAREEFDQRLAHKADWAVVESSDDVIKLVRNRILCGWGGDVTVDFCEGRFDPTKPVDAATGNIAGGHEMVIVWWDSTTDLFLVLNSWGLDWGLSGFFWATRRFIESGYNKQAILRANEVVRIAA